MFLHTGCSAFCPASNSVTRCNLPFWRIVRCGNHARNQKLPQNAWIFDSGFLNFGSVQANIRPNRFILPRRRSFRGIGECGSIPSFCTLSNPTSPDRRTANRGRSPNEFPVLRTPRRYARCSVFDGIESCRFGAFLRHVSRLDAPLSQLVPLGPPVLVANHARIRGHASRRFGSACISRPSSVVPARGSTVTFP